MVENKDRSTSLRARLLLYASIAVASITVLGLILVFYAASAVSSTSSPILDRGIGNASVSLELKPIVYVKPSILYSNKSIVEPGDGDRVPGKLIERIEIIAADGVIGGAQFSPKLEGSYRVYLNVEGYRILLKEERGIKAGRAIIGLENSEWREKLREFYQETSLDYRGRYSVSVEYALDATAPGGYSPRTSRITASIDISTANNGLTYSFSLEKAKSRAFFSKKIMEENSDGDKESRAGIGRLGLLLTAFGLVATPTTIFFYTRMRRDNNSFEKKAKSIGAYSLVELEGVPKVFLEKPVDVLEVAKQTKRPLLLGREEVCVVVETTAYCSRVERSPSFEARNMGEREGAL